MRKHLLWAIGGLGAGLILAAVVMIVSAPPMMMTESVSQYDFEETLRVFEQTVADNGWKIPTVHDMQKTMDKYDHEVLDVMVYELCHPEHASRILKLDDERIVSSMMPCRVSFYKKSDGKVYISRMNSGLVGRLFGGVIAEVMNVAANESEMLIKPLL